MADLSFLNRQLQSQMGLDASNAAAHIIRDMGRAFDKPGAFWADYLGQRFGDYRRVSLVKQKKNRWGVYDMQDESILIERTLNVAQFAKTIRHEIAHKLAIGTDRYIELNEPHFVYYDWLTFHELIARFVMHSFDNPEAMHELLTWLH